LTALAAGVVIAPVGLETTSRGTWPLRLKDIQHDNRLTDRCGNLLRLGPATVYPTLWM